MKMPLEAQVLSEQLLGAFIARHGILPENAEIVVCEMKNGETRIHVRERQEPARGIDDIIEAVCREFGCPDPHLIRTPCRRSDVVLARNIVMLILREYHGMTTVNTGRAVGRDHSTAVHGVRNAKKRIENSQAFRIRYEALVTGLSPLTPIIP